MSTVGHEFLLDTVINTNARTADSASNRPLFRKSVVFGHVFPQFRISLDLYDLSRERAANFHTFSIMCRSFNLSQVFAHVKKLRNSTRLRLCGRAAKLCMSLLMCKGLKNLHVFADVKGLQSCILLRSRENRASKIYTFSLI